MEQKRPLAATHKECCGTEECSSKNNLINNGHDHEGHDHGGTATPGWLSQWPLLTALLIIVIMLVLNYGFGLRLSNTLELAVYVPAYLLSGYHVLELAFRKALRLDIFNEFFLMSVATLGAFAIGSYSEGVAVMVFYSIGEWFQDTAVSNAKKSIKALLDVRPERVRVMRDGEWKEMGPQEAGIGETFQVRPGEKVALDGELISANAAFNTAALTGESMPDNKSKGQPVLAGMINLNQPAEIRITALFKDSKLSRILEMVQDATARKSRTQLFISRFAKIYTPVVFLLAVCVVLLPAIFVADYVFREWLYRGLVFLVISCPCALVVSIPLGYFGGIGLASRNGILFKGSGYLDVMAKVDTVVMDKTGTLTKGIFKVQQVVSHNFEKEALIRLTAALESTSTHPVALAIVSYSGNLTGPEVSQVEELPGYGLKGVVNGAEVLAGNTRLLKKYGISYDPALDEETDTLVAVAVDRRYAGYILIADEIKEDSAKAIADLHSMHIRTVMLSGDKQLMVNKIAGQLGIEAAFGDLLPEQKVEKVQALKDAGSRLAFAGDGINDAPVIALADAGIAMGGLGSDAAIETADIVIQNDQPSRIALAIKAGRITRQIVWQNIALAMGIKVIVLVLGAGGVATLWEAVIADVGVALLAILNAVRIQRIRL